MKRSLLMIAIFMLINIATFAQSSYTVKADGMKGYKENKGTYALIKEESNDVRIYFNNEVVIVSIDGVEEEFSVIDIHPNEDKTALHLAISYYNGKYSEEFIYYPESNEFGFIDTKAGILIKFTNVVVTKNSIKKESGNWKRI
jgi:hypothetical protein